MQAAAREADGGGDGVDHISDLCDDLLLHVLRFLSDDARDVVCTSALSTRWRSLWTRAPVLRIGNWIRNGRHGQADDPRFNDFVHNVLARRVVGYADIDTLKLSTLLWPGKSRADVWLRRAMRLTVTSLKFQVLSEWETTKKKRIRLPTTTRLTTLSLQLYNTTLLLPPVVKFHSLTDLTLTYMTFSDHDGPRLGHLLSSPSCCPRLRKLTLSSLARLDELRLDGEVLETLHLETLHDLRRLDVDAPRLSALHSGSHFMFYQEQGESSISVRAPALKKLVASLTLGFGNFQLQLQRHTIQLLQQCRPIDSHCLRLNVREEQEEDEALTDIPQLPGVTNLTIEYCSKNSHYLGAIMSSLLERCSNLEYLQLDNQIHLQMKYGPRCEEGCADCDLRGSWKDDVISLEHLREVKFSGFSGQEHCFIDMVQLLLVSAPTLKRIILTAKLMLAESLESCLPHGRGKWTAHPATDDVAITSEYEWTPNLEMLVTNGATNGAGDITNK